MGEAASIPLPDASADVVLSVFGAIFAPDPRAAADEMVRVLPPDGRMLLAAWIPEEIKSELAKLPPDRAPNRRDWSRLSAGWSSRIDERIAELERLRAGLDECIGCGCLSLDRCKLANPGDRAGRAGPGPRYWVGDPRPG